MTRTRVMPFVALEGSTLLAGLANGVSMVALPWLVLDLTGRADAAGLVALISGLPTLLASLFSGTLVDTLGRRRTSVFSDLMSAVSVAAIPIVALTTGLTFTWVLVLAVLGAVFDPAGVTARESMLTGVSQATGMRLERVNGIHEAVWGLAFLVGPAVGAGLIATIGVESAFWAMAVAFVASAVLLAFVHVPGAGRPHYDNRPYFWAGTMDGLRLVFSDAPLRTVVLLSTGVVGLAYPVIGIVLPVIYQGNDDPVGLGAVVMAFSFGGVVGALLYSSFGHQTHPRGTFAVSLWGAALSLVVFAIWPETGVMMAAGFAGGILLGPMNPIINLALQRRTPEHMRGRALGVVTALAYGIYPIGYAVAGLVVETYSVETALAVFALGSVALALAASVAPALKRLDEEPLEVSVGASI
ncbi:MAG TPA: MFS transporter [Actinomycetes bacterium]|nr:MFS transporter [Actinomycetes bacterium]